VLVAAFTPAPPECDVRDPLSCNAARSEVCLFVNGTYKCACSTGYSRLPDGRCLVLNECADTRLNDCSSDAQCIDEAESYRCACRAGYADVSPDKTKRPGRRCRLIVNECADPAKYNVNCHNDSLCVDTEEGYTCRCRPGFVDVSELFNMLPGRRCAEAVNECASKDKNDCSPNAVCEDTKIGYSCRCRDSYVDVSPNITRYPGRVCNEARKPPDIGGTNGTDNLQLDPCEPNNNTTCKAGEVCKRDARGNYVCDCAANQLRFDGVCKGLC
jgi:hypothetical protein